MLRASFSVFPLMFPSYLCVEYAIKTTNVYKFWLFIDLKNKLGENDVHLTSPIKRKVILCVVHRISEFETEKMQCTFACPDEPWTIVIKDVFRIINP